MLLNRKKTDLVSIYQLVICVLSCRGGDSGGRNQFIMVLSAGPINLLSLLLAAHQSDDLMPNIPSSKHF